MKKRGAMDIILILMGIFLFLFTITMIVIFCVKGATPDTLIDRVITCCIGEGGIMGMIQVAKVIKDKKEEDNDN